MHKVKDKVTREVSRMYKDLEFSVRADDWDKYPGFLRLPLEFSVRADDWDKYPGFLRLPLVVDWHVGKQVEWLGGAQGEGQGHQGGRQDVQGLRI